MGEERGRIRGEIGHRAESTDGDRGRPGRGALDARLSRDAVERLRAEWRVACERLDSRLPSFQDAVVELARDARVRGADVSAVLRALDSVIRPDLGGDRRLDCDSMRERAGSAAIRAFYRDD